MSGIDWPGLLKWSISYQDGTSDNVKKPMSAEKRRHLEAALEKYYGSMKDPHEACKEALENVDPTNVDATMGALQVIRDLTVDTPELARNFAKIGAAESLVQVLAFKEPYAIPVVILAVRILGEVSQNNPDLQEALVKLGAIRQCCEILKQTSDGMIECKKKIADAETGEDEKKTAQELSDTYRDLRHRTMSCVSNIIRHNKRAEDLFARQGGLTWINYAIKQKDNKFLITSLLLLFHLLAEETINASSLLKPERSAKSGLLASLMQKFTTHDLSDGPQLGEIFAQVMCEVWAKGGRELPEAERTQFRDAVDKKLVILDRKIELENQKPEGDFRDSYEHERDMLVNLKTFMMMQR